MNFNTGALLKKEMRQKRSSLFWVTRCKQKHLFFSHKKCHEMELIQKLTEELEESLRILDTLNPSQETEEESWKAKEANYVKIQVELKSKNDALKAQNYQLAQALEDTKAELSALQAREKNGNDKIAALRNVARALEAENQLLAGEKEHLERFKNQFCKENGSLR